MEKSNEVKCDTEAIDGLFSLNLDLICIVDRNGAFVKNNNGFLTILGYLPQELNNKAYLDFVHHHDLEATRFAIEQLISTKEIMNFVNRYRSKDNTYRYIEWDAHLSGEYIYAAGRDITQKKLNETALVKAKEQVDTANNIKHQFLANISHEIRTPMNGILGFIQLLENTELTSKQQLFIKNMKLSSILLSNVINDILDMSKMETNEIDLEIVPFDLYATVEDAMRPYAASA
ncbi:histidine kinase dimerization/phospho-acceptor domain-containing protein, partial [Acetobacterium sp.]|uniref:histidine kinase dimerization/phospho-acceptor domain-containing protein n=1 Tax=Acetobacterium sp. TaxID=1872094 RepID=UPI00271A5DB3